MPLTALDTVEATQGEKVLKTNSGKNAFFPASAVALNGSAYGVSALLIQSWFFQVGRL